MTNETLTAALDQLRADRAQAAARVELCDEAIAALLRMAENAAVVVYGLKPWTPPESPSPSVQSSSPAPDKKSYVGERRKCATCPQMISSKIADQCRNCRREQAQKTEPVVSAPVSKTPWLEPAAPIQQFPERRCGRCLHKFKPTAERQYVCADCVTEKPKLRTETPSHPEMETVWNGDKNGPPLTDATALGSSLAGESRVHK